MNWNYQIPLDFTGLLQRKNEHLHCSLLESIERHIILIITTKMESFRYDPDYGCAIWEKDFIVPADLTIWSDQIQETLENAVRQHEKRIENVTFNLRVVPFSKGVQRINQRLDISIAGDVKGTSERFEFEETLYFSPYSIV